MKHKSKLPHQLKKMTYAGLIEWNKTTVIVESGQYEGYITRIHGTTVTIFTDAGDRWSYAILVEKNKEEGACSTNKKLLDTAWIEPEDEQGPLASLYICAHHQYISRTERGEEPWIDLEFYLGERLYQGPTLMGRIRTMLRKK